MKERIILNLNKYLLIFLSILILFVFITSASASEALSNLLWVVVLGCDFFVQDIAFVPSYCHMS